MVGRKGQVKGPVRGLFFSFIYNQSFCVKGRYIIVCNYAQNQVGNILGNQQRKEIAVLY